VAHLEEVLGVEGAHRGIDRIDVDHVVAVLGGHQIVASVVDDQVQARIAETTLIDVVEHRAGAHHLRRDLYAVEDVDIVLRRRPERDPGTETHQCDVSRVGVDQHGQVRLGQKIPQVVLCRLGDDDPVDREVPGLAE